MAVVEKRGITKPVRVARPESGPAATIKPEDSPALLTLTPDTSADIPLIDLGGPSASSRPGPKETTYIPGIPHTPVIYGPDFNGPYIRLNFIKASPLPPFQRIFVVAMASPTPGYMIPLDGWHWIEFDLCNLDGDQILETTREIQRKCLGTAPRLTCEKSSWVVAGAHAVYIWKADAHHLPS
jgi:hypothetical protein